jgi:hypothetical protein
VTGIGFLGAGAIIRTGGSVQGLTTAATVWVNAAIGVAAGGGRYILAVGATALTIVVLLALTQIEKMMARGVQASGTSSRATPWRTDGYAQQRTERPQVPRVPGIDIAAAPALGRIQLGRLEQHRHGPRTGGRSAAAERLEPEAALADVLVPIDTAAARLLRVVQVEHLEPLEANDAVERIERRPVALVRPEVVSRRHQVAGVQAHTDATAAGTPCIEQVEDGAEVLEPMPEVGALSGCVLQQDAWPAPGRVTTASA